MSQAVTCRECGLELTDPVSRAFRLGSEHRKGKTPKQLDEALRLTLAEKDPGYIPPERPTSTQARWNNHTARAAATAPAADQLCDGGHGGIKGACPQCRAENDPNQAAARIIREIRRERAHPSLETLRA
jgi:hypothetical protein